MNWKTNNQIERTLKTFGIPKHVYYVDARCGEGKTLHAIRELVIGASSGELWVLAQPTNKLLAQTARITLATLHNLKPNANLQKLIDDYGDIPIGDLPFVRVINSEQKRDTSVQKSILEHLDENAFGSGNVLLVSHSALFSLPRGHRLWNLIVDESHQCFNYFNRKAAKTERFILDNTTAGDARQMDGYKRIAPKSRTARQQLATLFADDDALTTYQQLVRELLSPSFQCFIKSSDWETFHQKDDPSLVIHSILTPKIIELFDRTTIMSARFHETLLYRIWSGPRFNVNFVVDDRISQHLSGDPRHITKKPVIIRYALKGQRYSKTFYRTKDKNGKTLHQLIDEKAQQHLNGEPSLCTTNNDISDHEIALMKNGAKRVSSLSHGIDQFKDIHHFTFLSALNLRNESYSFLQYFGVTADDVLTGITYHAIYQGACRTSIRTGQSDTSNILVVPTLEMAEWLSNCFEKATIERLPGDFAEFFKKRRAAMTTTERSRRKDASDSIRKLLDMNGINDSDLPVAELIGSESDSAVTRLIEIANDRSLNNRYFVGKTLDDVARFFKSKKFKDPSYFDDSNSEGSIISAQFFKTLRSRPHPELCAVGSFDELESTFRSLFRRYGIHPDDTGAMSPALFGNLKREGFIDRGERNLKYAILLMLDIDDGKLTPQRLREIFPNTDIITYGTSTAGRFRAVFRLSLLVDTKIYKTVRFHVIAKIAESCPDHGIKDCQNPVNLFRLPYRGPNTSYPVERQKGEALDVLSLLKKVHFDIIEDCNARQQATTITTNPSGKTIAPWQEDAARKAMRTFEGIGVNAGRYVGFYKLAVRLGHLFGDEALVRNFLDQSCYDHPEKPRRINNCILSLIKAGLLRS